MSLAEQKQALRQQMAKLAETLPPDYLAHSDEEILKTLLALPAFQQAGTVFCYVSVGVEPDTRRLIEKLFEMGKTVCVPRCQKGGKMHACSISHFAQLLPAGYGLLEPSQDAETVSPGEIDLVVAPCVTAAEDGGRLGHGAGFYDRFLALTHCPVYCLCYGRLLQPEVPMGLYDCYMDLVITEQGTFPRP